MKKTIPIFAQKVIAIIFLLAISTQFGFATGPTITNFNPTSDPIGTSVTITGTGFNATAAQNIVLFGATKATVTAGSTTSLTVTVPTGSTYQYVSVTNLGTNLTAYSAAPFDVTGPGNIAFSNPISPATAANPYGVFISDVDLDGKPDLLVISNSGGVVSLFPNTSSGGTVSFGTRQDFATAAAPYNLAVGDIDGDGKPDVVTANQTTGNVSVLLNTSTGPGNFGFATHVEFTASSSPSSISINDIDGDGKPDVVASDQGITYVSILRNTSTPGTASFASVVNVSVGAGTRPIAVGVGDFDGNGKPDLAVANYNGNSVSILPNTSTPGTITFGTRIDIALTGTINPNAIAIGDLDGDGLLDLAVSSYGGQSIYLFRNTSSVNSISFAAYTTYSIPSTTWDVTIGDINGDGLPDLATLTNSTNLMYVLKNTSTPGNISFTSSSFSTGNFPRSVKIADLNGDGLPDMVETNSLTGTVGVFIQKTPPQGSLTANGPFCTSGTGKLTFTATAGTGPFSIVYYDGVANRTASGVVSGTAFNAFTNPVTATTTYQIVSVTDASSLVRSSGFTQGSAIVTINAVPTVYNVTGGTNCGATTVGLSGSQNGVNYQLYNFASTVGSPLAGNNGTVSFGSQSTAGTYTVVAVNATTSCTSNMSGSAAVNANPTIFAVGGGANCGAITVTLSGSASGVNYQLYCGASTVGVATTGTGSLLNFGSQTAVGNYTVVATNATTLCTANMSGSAAVDAIPTAFAVGGGTNCGATMVTLSGSTSGVNYQLYCGASTVGGATTGTGSALNFGNQTAVGNYTVVGTDAITSCTANMSGSAAVNASPTVYTVTGGIHCGATTIGLSGSDNGVSYQLYNFGNPVGSAHAGNSSGFSFGSQTAAGTYTVVAINTTTFCTGYMSGSPVVNTNPSATASNTGPYAAGQTIQLNALPTGLSSYSWSGPNSYNYASTSASVTIANSTSAMQGTYTVTVTDANGCMGIATTAIAIIGPPTITSFTPTSGVVGSSVIITGTNFNSTAANNIVFFGATRATVTAASSTSLTVTVPEESTNQPITETNGSTHLTAYSATPFGVTLSGSTNFLPQVTTTTSSQPDGVNIGDIDGDGKADLLVGSLGGQNLAVFHNNSTLGNVSFSSALNLTGGNGAQRPVVGDIDGDGKPDVAMVLNGGTTIAVYHNTYTTVGTPAFAAALTFTVGNNPNSVAIGDIDGDGIADLVVANGGDGTISVLHGTSSPGTISFSNQVTYLAGINPQGISIADIDGDGKPDIVVANYGSNTISVYHNSNTTSGTPSFAAQVTYATGTNPNGISIGDIDGDGKADVVVGNQGGGNVSVLHNNYTTIGTPSFSAQATFNVGSEPYTVKIADVNGDGKLDIVSSNNGSGTLSILKNNFTITGTPSFATQVTYTTASSCNYIAVVDIDGDGFPDLVTSNYGNNTVSVLLQIGVTTYAWTGTNGSSWTDVNNWSPVAPVGGPNACTVNVVIPVTANAPALTSAVGVANLQLNAGAQLTLTGANLSVCKNFTGGAGTSAVVNGTGLLVLNGTAAQTISGTTQVRELLLDNTSGASMQGGSILNVTGALDLQAGTFDATNGNLTFKSTAVNSVGIIDNFSSGYGGTITGNFNAERSYSTPGSNSYSQHMMGSPVNSPSLAQFGASGSTAFVTPTSNCDETKLATGSAYGNVFSYHESNGQVCELAQWKVEGGGTAQNGLGYSVVKPGTGVMTVNGSANLIDVSVSGLTNTNGWTNTSLQGNPYESGWQLLANPFLSTIVINPSVNSTFFDNQVQIWDAGSGNYVATTTVAPFQAFLVHKSIAGGSATFSIPATERVRTAATFYQLNANQLTLHATNNTTGKTDDAIVGFNTDATDTFDALYDANKLHGSLNRHTMYSVNNNKWLLQNILHDIAGNPTVPVGFEPGNTASYTISFIAVNSFDPTSTIYLEDKVLNIMHDARSGDYTFSADSGDDRNRFVLHFTPPTQVSGLGNITAVGAPAIWSNNNLVYVDFTQLQNVDATVTIYNVLGQQLSSERYSNAGVYQKAVGNMDAAYVIVRVRNGDEITSKNIFITNTK